MTIAGWHIVRKESLEMSPCKVGGPRGRFGSAYPRRQSRSEHPVGRQRERVVSCADVGAQLQRSALSRISDSGIWQQTTYTVIWQDSECNH